MSYDSPSTPKNQTGGQPATFTHDPGNTHNPGKVWGIVGFVLAFFPFLSLVGIILSIVGLVKSKRAGAKNGLAIAGIIVGIVVLIVTVLITISIIALTGATLEILEQCQNDPGGTATVAGEAIDCAQLQP